MYSIGIFCLDFISWLDCFQIRSNFQSKLDFAFPNKKLSSIYLLIKLLNYLAVVNLNAQFYSHFSGPNFAQIFEEIVVHLLFLAVKHQFLRCEQFEPNFAQNYEQKSSWSQVKYWLQRNSNLTRDVKNLKSCLLQEKANEQRFFQKIWNLQKSCSKLSFKNHNYWIVWWVLR